MKKIFLHLLVASIFFFPTYAFASVDFTLQEDIASTDKVFTVNVNTQEEVIEELDFSIKYTDGIEITNVKDNNSTCSTLRSVSQNNILNIVCTFDTPQSVNSVVATVSFENLNESYSFTLLDDNSLKIGSLSLGNVTNIENNVLAETDEITTTTAEDTTLETTADTTAKVVAENTEIETGTEAKTITDYLPWILLGGAGILLISIIAIIFSGKKEEATNTEGTITPNVKPEETTNTASVPTLDNTSINPPTDIDNISNSLYTPQLNTETVKEETPVQEAMPVASTETQVSDLEALKTDTQVSTEETPVLNTESTPQNDFSSFNMNTPVDQPLIQETTMPETPISDIPVQTEDMQQSNVPNMSSFDTVPQVVVDNTPTTPGFDIPTNQSTETTISSFDNSVSVTPQMDMNNIQDNFNTTTPVENPATVTPPMDNAMPTFDNTPAPQVDTVASPQDSFSGFNMNTQIAETPTTPMPNIDENTPPQQPNATIPTDYLSTDTQNNDTDTLPPTPPLM